MISTDSQLLQEYSERQSDAAFGELVRRHVDLVYSAALRMVRDAHLAEDVTQGTFVALSRNATQLHTDVVLSAWLHRTAQNIAAQTVRTEVRRRLREQEAVAMNDKFAGDGVGDAQWQDVEPHLDEALGELSEGDRGAVMLRYFEGKTAREMSAILGISDEASQKRVARAVERLREFMAKKGVAVGASGITALVSANAVQAAPVALAGCILSTIALSGATMATASVSTTLGSINVMTTSLVKSILVGLAAVTAAVIIGVQHQKAAVMREELNQLHAQVQKTEAAYADLVQQSKTRSQPVVHQDSNQTELLQLRNEVGRLRAAAKEKVAPIAPAVTEQVSAIGSATVDLKAALRQKLETIRIKEVAFGTLPLGEVLKRLKDESKRGDPNGKGVNFILNNHDGTGSARSIDLQAISIQLPTMTNASIMDVQDAIVRAANGSITYTVEAYAVMFRPKFDDSH